MARATPKRSLEWEDINQRSTKRRRCNAFGQSTSADSPYDSLESSLNCQLPSMRFTREPQSNPFMEGNNLSKISPDKMSQNLRDKIKRLHRRKQLPFTTAAIERMQDCELSGSEMEPDSPSRQNGPPNMVLHPEKELFTFKQVQLICERMLKKREVELCEKYDAVVTTKLAQQYDAFVKFTYDQIQISYEAAPSYLS